MEWTYLPVLKGRHHRLEPAAGGRTLFTSLLILFSPFITALCEPTRTSRGDALYSYYSKFGINAVGTQGARSLFLSDHQYQRRLARLLHGKNNKNVPFQFVWSLASTVINIAIISRLLLSANIWGGVLLRRSRSGRKTSCLTPSQHIRVALQSHDVM